MINISFRPSRPELFTSLCLCPMIISWTLVFISAKGILTYRSIIAQNFQSRTESFQFHLPINNAACRDNDQVRSPDTFITSEVG